ncbi:MAG: acyloxyacyl hydrolase [Balneolaceae bacterium]|nr:acyloxyacyl hydrolase [Balneolaceae bacterium]
MGKVAVEYAGLGLQVVYPYKVKQDELGNNTHTAVGISYKREIIHRILKVGAVVFNRRFPTDSGIPFNFILDAGYSFNHLRLSYVHISNAGLGRLNAGMDTIQILILL